MADETKPVSADIGLNTHWNDRVRSLESPWSACDLFRPETENTLSVRLVKQLLHDHLSTYPHHQLYH